MHGKIFTPHGREVFRILREQWTHEDNMINQRTGWGLAIQSFFISSTLFIVKENDNEYILISSVVLAMLGLFLDYTSLRGLSLANEAHEIIQKKYKSCVSLIYKDRRCVKCLDLEYPEMTNKKCKVCTTITLTPLEKRRFVGNSPSVVLFKYVIPLVWILIIGATSMEIISIIINHIYKYAVPC